MRFHLRWLWVPAWLLLSGSSQFTCSSSGGVLVHDDDFFNATPVASDDELMATVSEPLMDTMRATDEDGDELVFSIVQTSSLGVVTVDDIATGAFTYVASAEGEDAFSFVANDGRTNSNRATITIVVSANTVQFSKHDTGNPAARCEPPTAGVAVDPFDPSHWLRVSGSTVERSVDGGGTWRRVWIDQHWSKPDYAHVSFSSDLPGLIYMGLNHNHQSSSIHRSNDGGQTWKLIWRLDGSLASVRSTQGTPPDSIIVTVEICGRFGEFVAVDHAWR